MSNFSEDETKRIYKEALKEWLDDKFAEFGRWTFYGLASAILAAAVYFVLSTNGWHK